MKHHHALVQWPLLAVSFTVLCSEVLSMLIDVELNASITTNSKPSTMTKNSTTNSTVSTGEDVPTKGVDKILQLLGSNIYLVLAVGGLLLCAAIWLAWRYFYNNSAESEDNARGNENGVQHCTDSSQSPSEPSPEDPEIPNKDAKKVDKKRKNAQSEAISKRKKEAKRVKSPAQRRPLTTIDNLTSGQETSSGATSGATSSIGSTLPAISNSKASQAGSKKGSTASPIKRTSMLKSMVDKMKSVVVNAFSAKKEEKDEEGKKKDKKDKKKAKKDKDKPESPPSP